MFAFLVLTIFSLSANTINSKSLEIVKEYSNLIPQDEKDSLCLTKGCVLSAGSVLSNMDSSVDPCENFYNFACGNFIKNNFIPDDKSSLISFNIISDILSEKMKNSVQMEILPEEIRPFKILKEFYQKCTNEEDINKDGLNVIKTILQENENWPVLQGSDWKESDFHWTETMYKFRKIGLPYDAFLSVYAGPDTKNTSRNIINIDQAPLGLEREHLIKGFDDVVVQAYYKFLVDLAVVFGADPEAAIKEISDVVKFEIKLAHITLSREVRRNVSLLYNPMSIDELHSKYPFIPWYEYINSIIDIEKIELNSKEIVDLGVPTYLLHLQELLEKTPKRIQANYIIVQVVSSVVPYLTEELQNLQLKFDKIVYGNEQREPIWKECLDLTLKQFKQAAGALYVRKYFDKNSKTNAMNLVKNLKASFLKMLKDLDWMDAATKERAIEKANAMGSFVGYPEELLDDKVLSEYYENLKITEDDTFLMAYLKSAKFRNDKSFSELPKPVNMTYWADHSWIATVNAFYDPEENSIQLPGGILQGVFFDNDRPQYMNYGAMGFAIGHEITHGFDDVGRQFDKDGVLSDWWEKETQDQFMEKARCIIDQYSNYSASSINLHLDGVNTQGENIADNGGVKEAYLAYQDWVKENGEERLLPGVNYTQNQLFWISCANLWCSVQREEYLKNQVLTDDHSPSEFRILGALSNSEYFAKDFNCPTGSNMNPERKCSVW